MDKEGNRGAAFAADDGEYLKIAKMYMLEHAGYGSEDDRKAMHEGIARQVAASLKNAVTHGRIGEAQPHRRGR